MLKSDVFGKFLTEVKVQRKERKKRPIGSFLKGSYVLYCCAALDFKIILPRRAGVYVAVSKRTGQELYTVVTSSRRCRVIFFVLAPYVYGRS